MIPNLHNCIIIIIITIYDYDSANAKASNLGPQTIIPLISILADALCVSSRTATFRHNVVA